MRLEALGRADPPAPPPAKWHCDAFTQAELTDFVGSIYFEQGAYSDNSFGCWVTDFMWGLGLLYGAYWLGSRSRFPTAEQALRNVDRDLIDNNCVRLCSAPFYEHTRYMFTWGFIWLGLSEILAGWYHCYFTEVKSHKHDIVWTLAILTLSLHTSFWFMACIAMHQVRDNTWKTLALYAIASGSGFFFFVAVFALDMNFPTAFGLGSLVPAIFVVIMSLYQSLLYGWNNTYKDTLPLVGGCACMILGICFATMAGFVCANPCPEQCPFGVPNFNHNAMFHVVALIGVPFLVHGISGICFELEDPDGMPYFDMGLRNLRRQEHQKLVSDIEKQFQDQTNLKWTTWSPND